jgi:hypothetical protein
MDERNGVEVVDTNLTPEALESDPDPHPAATQTLFGLTLLETFPSWSPLSSSVPAFGDGK